jgi:hypothetical protein
MFKNNERSLVWSPSDPARLMRIIQSLRNLTRDVYASLVRCKSIRTKAEYKRAAESIRIVETQIASQVEQIAEILTSARERGPEKIILMLCSVHDECRQERESARENAKSFEEELAEVSAAQIENLNALLECLGKTQERVLRCKHSLESAGALMRALHRLNKRLLRQKATLGLFAIDKTPTIEIAHHWGRCMDCGKSLSLSEDQISGEGR